MNLKKTKSRLERIAATDDPRQILRLAEALGDELPRNRMDVLNKFRTITSSFSIALGPNAAARLALQIFNVITAAYQARMAQAYDWRKTDGKNTIIEAWPVTPSRGVYYLCELDGSAWSAFLRFNEDALSFLGLRDLKRHTDRELEEVFIRLGEEHNETCFVDAQPAGECLPLEIKLGRYIFPLVKLLGANNSIYLDLVRPSPLMNARPPAQPPVDTDKLPWL